MPKHLTVQDKIVIHLAAYMRYAEEFECPEEVSQAGIASAIGKSRAHTTLELKALRDAELISERVSHVRGAKSKRKVYNLASSGIQLAQNLRSMIDSLEVNMEIDGEVSEFGGRMAIEELTSRAGISELDAMNLIISTDGVIRPNAPVPEKAQATNIKQDNLPELKYFYGREKDIEGLMAFLNGEETLLSITGMPGIGKTTLARQLVATDKDRKFFYIQLYGFDSPISFVQQLARYLSSVNYKQLGDYIANKASPDLREVSWLLGDIFSKERFAIILDDLDVVSDSFDGFLRMIHDVLRSSGSSQMIVLSNKTPGFYDRKDVNIERSVSEMELEGLDHNAAMALLDKIGKVDEEAREDLIGKVAGHPLALELAEADTGTGNFHDYIYEQIISRDIDGFDFLSLSSVMRMPFSPWDMKIFGFSRAQTLSSNSYFTKYDSGLVMIHKAVADAVLNKAGEKGIKLAHERAAHYCRDYDIEPSEVLYHLIEAGMNDQAKEMVDDIRNYLLSNTNLEMTLLMLGKLNTQLGERDAELLDIMAEVMNLTGDWDGAMSLSSAAADDRTTEQNIRALIRMARIENKKGNSDKAMENIKEAEELSITLDELVMASDIMLTKGIILHGIGEYKEAMKAFGQSIDISKENEDKKGYLRGLMERGNIDVLIGSFRTAGKDYELALRTAEELNSQIDVARIKLNIGLLHMKMDELQKASKDMEIAISIGREICQPRIIGWGLIGISECYNKMNKPEESLERSEEARQIFESLGIPDLLSAVYSNIGMAKATLGDDEEAITNFEKSIELIEDLDGPYTHGQRYLEYGKGKHILGKTEEAMKLLTKAQTIFVDIGAEEEARQIANFLKDL